MSKESVLPKYNCPPFPDGLEYYLHGPMIRTNIYLNLTFDSSDPGQYHVVHPETMRMGSISPLEFLSLIHSSLTVFVPLRSLT